MSLNKTEQWVEWHKCIRWLADIPEGSDLILFPLQIANAKRILENDAVFIFDEVGCGKTISSGIMAKSYLYSMDNNTPGRILVITTNSVKHSGQFINDWRKLDINMELTVYNNLIRSDLKYLKKEEIWDLVIIDEAHEFNHTDTQKYNKLISDLRAHKVVFLSATPLRSGESFSFYKDLATAILNLNEAPPELEELDHLTDLPTEEQNLLCAKFDPSYPITRYFKDTVKYLDIHEKKEKAHRVVPELWRPKDGESREDALVSHIFAKYSKNNFSRFLVFVSRKAEAASLKEAICKKESWITAQEKKGVEIVFANNKETLKNYSNTESIDLPIVLIVNWQVAEAGINLPGYDHVIHWNISSDPARLEQRYGRIDRMTSRHEKIYSCFVEPTSYDSNYKNFISAIDYTMGELLTTLPARNVLLTEDTLNYYKTDFYQKRDKSKAELEELRQCKEYLENKETINYSELIRCFKFQYEDTGVDCSFMLPPAVIECMATFIDEIKYKSDPEELVESLLQQVNKRIRSLEKKLNRNEEINIDPFVKCINQVSKDSDKIFYLTAPRDPGSLQTIPAQGKVEQDGKILQNGCASYIDENENYQRLKEAIKVQEAVITLRRYIDRTDDLGDKNLLIVHLLSELGRQVLPVDEWNYIKKYL